MEGYLSKKGNRLPTWRKRYMAVSGSKLKWYYKQGGEEKGEVDLSGATITVPEETSGRKRQYATVRTASRELQLYSERDIDAWVIALRAAARSSTPASAGSGSSPTADGIVTTPLAVLSVQQLPSRVEFEGENMVGTQLRIRVANMRKLDSLSVIWFRYSGDGQPAFESDIATDPNMKAIAGAAGVAYTIVDADVGFRIGCIVKPPTVSVSRWAVMPSKVTAVASEISTISLLVDAHEHNKYCDRRVRVCTAMDRVREGNTLLAVIKGKDDVIVGSKIVWYRSNIITALQLGEEAVKASQAAAGDALATPVTAEEEATSASLHAGSVACAPRNSAVFSYLSTAQYRRIDPRAPSDMPPCPPDYAPSAGIDEIQSYMRVLDSGSPVAAVVGTATTDPSGPHSNSCAAAKQMTGSMRYTLFKEDIGRSIIAVVLPKDAEEPADVVLAADGSNTVLRPDGSPVSSVVAVCAPCGPVEAAPPKAREIWIEGEPRVGNVLRGRVYYYGGYAGAHEVSWIAINHDGDTVELKPPAQVPVAYAATSDGTKSATTDDASGVKEDISDSDPRVLRLTSSHDGFLIKFKVKPIRSDGDDGHTESSRPTKEVAAE